jgi:hypothetical protein
MRRSFFLAVTILAVLATGCQTTRPKTVHEPSEQEAMDAVGTVTGALTGKELTEAEKRKAVRDLRKDKEAQSAMRSISGALEVKQTGIKYCPVDGQRFAAELEMCPIHKVKLKELTD